MFATNPEIEIEVEKVSEILKALPIDGMASYTLLSEVVGYNITKRPFVLMKARRLVEKETGLRFGTVRAEGVKKLDGNAVAGIGAAVRQGIARKAKVHASRLAGLRYNDIAPESRQRIDAERSLLGAIAATAKADVKRVEREAVTGPVVAAKIFEMMNRFD